MEYFILKKGSYLKSKRNSNSELFLTHPPSPSLKTKGRGVIYYNTAIYALPLLLKGRVGEGF